MGNRNKVRYGLKNVHYALLSSSEDGTVSYGKPVVWPGAVSIKFSAQGSQEPFYADDIKYYVTSSNTGYNGDLETALVPQTACSWRMQTHSLFPSPCSLSLSAMPEPSAMCFITARQAVRISKRRPRRIRYPSRPRALRSTHPRFTTRTSTQTS